MAKSVKYDIDEVDLGDAVRDKITGFGGIVTGRCTYISGCDQLLITKKLKEDEGDMKSHWIDIDRCEITSKNVVKIEKVSNPKRPGADIAAPIK